MDSFVVQFWDKILASLRWLSPLELICIVFPKLRTHGWIDVWVFLNLIFSIVALFLASYTHLHILHISCVVYAAIRVLEIVVYQAKIVLFDPYRLPRSTSDYAVRSYRRIVVLALHNYLETILWFAGIYSVFRISFGERAQILSSAVGALYYSIVTMATLGYGEITPTNDWGRIIVIAHLVIAVFMSLIILARFIGFLPTPRTLDETER